MRRAEGRLRPPARARGADARGVVEDLRLAGVEEVDVSSRRLAEYSSDASNYRVRPTAVVFPADGDEVAAALGVARSHGLPVTCRGGGTSIAGNAVGSGLVLDFSRHMRKVLALDADARTAVVQPGATLDEISAAAAVHGLRFGPDPSTHARATLGGAVGNNACGARALGYGRTSDNVVLLEVITGRGERVRAGARTPGTDVPGPGGAEGRYRAALAAIVSRHDAVVRREFGRFRRQVSGYSLEHLTPEHGEDLARFLVGSEGTLGVVLEATVRLVESPPALALAVLGYPDMASAADAAPGAVDSHVVALEGMDSRLVDVVRARRGPAAVPDLPRGAGWLLVETAGATVREAQANADRVAGAASCLDSAVLVGADAAVLWRIREDGAGLGSRTPAGEPAWPGWEDAAVPPERLGAYLRDFERLLADHGLAALIYGHFGDGCVHARIDFPLSASPASLRGFLTNAAQLVARYGGSISGEHGDGRARSELLPFMYSGEAVAAFGEVKALFDPDNLLNPGVIVDPAPLDAGLRLATARPVALRLGFRYPHDSGDLSVAAHRCVGMAKCRADNTPSDAVMCPSFLATRDEKDSTRGRARVLQELAQGTLPSGFRGPELSEALDLCLACKGCLSDCPAGVDMATYKSEVLYQRYRHRVRPPSHYSLGWLPLLARLGSRVPGLAAALLRSPGPAALAKSVGGIDARRTLPSFAARGFRARVAGRPPRGGRPVLLWVDTFTEHFAPQVGESAVRVLEDAGYAVQLTRRQECCGLTWISTGQLDAARRRLRRAVGAIEGSVAPGTPVVVLEPSCAAVFRKDAPELLCVAGVESVAARVRTLAELLLETDGWRPPELRDVHGVAQPHCHHHAVMGWDADARLLATAGAGVRPLGGCCGLAGNFGFERGHYDVSVAVAETALLPAVRELDEGAVVLADGFSCRTQLLELAGVRGLHLAELLAGRLAGR